MDDLEEGHIRYRPGFEQNGPTITTITIGIRRRVFFTQISFQPRRKNVKWNPKRTAAANARWPLRLGQHDDPRDAPRLARSTIAAEPQLAASAPSARVRPLVPPPSLCARAISRIAHRRTRWGFTKGHKNSTLSKTKELVLWLLERPFPKAPKATRASNINKA